MGIIAGQKEGCPCDPVGLGNLPKRDSFEQGLLYRVGIHWSGQFGIGRPRTDKICRNPIWCDFRGHRSYKRLYTPLGSSVMATVRFAQLGMYTGHGNDPSPYVPFDQDRKSTRLNSSHVKISYAVFCLKKKKKKQKQKQ